MVGYRRLTIQWCVGRSGVKDGLVTGGCLTVFEQFRQESVRQTS